MRFPCTKRIVWIVLCGAVVFGSIGCANTPRNGDSARIANVRPPTAEQQERIANAYAYKDAGEYDTALAMFQDILAENPMVTTAYLGIGDIYIIRQDYEKAEPAYGRAARLEPRNFDAQYGHGLALQMLSRFIEAVRAYHRALTIDSASVPANLNLAVTYLQMNEPENAITFAERAVSLDPSNGSARINLGAAYEKVGRNAEAIEQYLSAMELVDHTPPLMMNLINVLAAERRYQEAVNVAENLVRIDQTANAYERLGWAYFRLSDFDKSLAAYREAVDIDPNHWQSHNGIGVNLLNKWLLSKKQDTEARRGARDAFRRSLRINPDQRKLLTLMSNYELER